MDDTNKAVVTGVNPLNRQIASAITTITYAIGTAGELEVLPHKSIVQTGLAYYQGLEYPGNYRPSLLRRDADMAPWRARTDLVVQGVARNDSPVEVLEVQLRCHGASARLVQSIHVTGDRWLERRGGQPRLSTPATFVEMPMRYDKAYGGTDELAEARELDPAYLELSRHVLGEQEHLESSDFSYPRNPAGKGFVIDPADHERIAWPNLEFSEDRLVPSKVGGALDRWAERPRPASFDWFPHAWFPRSAWWGVIPATHDGEIPELECRLGLVPENMARMCVTKRPRFGAYQGANPYINPGRLNGDERIEITNMSSRGQHTLFTLPGHRPRIDVKLPGSTFKQVEPVLDAVFVETEAQEVTLVWRGTRVYEGHPLPSEWYILCECKVAW